MYLKRIELQGFKSFAKRTLIEFPELKNGAKGITAIVGPNGSGKSNIADAIRWVLGEQSLKLLRCKKSEDIIFSGSESKGRMNFAEVSLYLDNEDKQADLEYPEIAITRQWYRDGASAYLINKNEVRLQDVVMLAAKAHVGQKSYAVIGQGMIDAVLSASPQERKNFFFEATGVREFQIKKEQSENKLARVKENLKQVELTLAELEPRVRMLTRQVKRLEKREAVEKELLGIQHQYYQSQWHAFEHANGEATEQLRALEQTRQAFETEAQNLQQELQAMETRETRGTLFEKLQAEYQKLLTERDEAQRKFAQLEGQMDWEYEKTGRLNMAWMNQRLSEIQRKQEELTLRDQHLRHESETAVQSLAAQQETTSRVDSELRQLSREIQQCQQKIQPNRVWEETKTTALIERATNMQKTFVERLEQLQSMDELPALRQAARELLAQLEQIARQTETTPSDEYTAKITGYQKLFNELLREKDALLSKQHALFSKDAFAKESLNHIQEEQKRLKQEAMELEHKLKNLNAPSTARQEMSQSLKEEQGELKTRLHLLKQQLETTLGAIEKLNVEEEQRREITLKLRAKFEDARSRMNAIIAKENEIRIVFAKLETRKEDLRREILTERNEAFFHGICQPLDSLSLPVENLSPVIQRLKQQLEMIGGIDEEVVSEYREAETRFTFLQKHYQDLSAAVLSLDKIIAQLEKKIDGQFTEMFTLLSKDFQKFFQTLFGGGRADIVKIIEDIPVEPISEDTSSTEEAEPLPDAPARKTESQRVFTGIEIIAEPPGKKVKDVAALSGGEKAMCAIALLCAIVATNPSPFIVLDEVDAALDERNSEKFADIIEQLASQSQFIVITHNRATMKRANLLWGVTAGNMGVSQLLGIKLEDAEKIAKQ